MALCFANQSENESDIVNMFECRGNYAGFEAIIPVTLVSVWIEYGKAVSVGQTVEFVTGEFAHQCAVHCSAMECDHKWGACRKLRGNILDIAPQSGADLYRGCLHPPTEMGGVGSGE